VSGPRFDIGRDFSWVAFGCLLVVLVVFVLVVVVGSALAATR